MTKIEFLKRVEDAGVWTRNEDGFFMKVWKECGYYILRAYSSNEEGWIAETYKRNPEDVVVSVKDGQIKIELKDEWIDAIGAANCESDEKADAEFLKGIAEVVPVKSGIAGRLSLETASLDEIEVYGL